MNAMYFMRVIQEMFQELKLWCYTVFLSTTMCFVSLKINFVVRDIYTDVHSDVYRHLLHDFDYTVPCDAVSLSVSEDVEMLQSVVQVKTVGGVNMCSFRNITFVIQKMTERESRKRLAKGWLPKRAHSCGNPAAAEPAHYALAHFGGINSYIKGNPYGTILNWSKKTNTSFVGQEFMYDNGIVRVNSTDFYFVYLTLTFHQRSKVTEDGTRGRPLTFMASINKRNSMYKDAIATRLVGYVVPTCAMTDDVTTFSIATHVFLRRYEEIYVTLMDADRLAVHNLTSNMFGIFKMR